jgi:hypothetical protein
VLKYFPRKIFRLGQERIYENDKRRFDSYGWISNEDNNPQERSFNPAKKVIRILKGRIVSEKEVNFIFINESDGVLGNFLIFYKGTKSLRSRLILLVETGSRTAQNISI